MLEEAPRSGITLRAIGIGMLLSAVLGVAAPYENLIISGSPMSFDHSTPAAVFFFFLFVIVIHPILGGIRRQWGFSQAELATVYIMGMIACTLPTNGLVAMLLPAISAGSYYATPENNWADLIATEVKPWLLVSDPQAVKGFYEGLSQGASIPWMAWVRPLSRWLPMLLGVYGAIVGMVVLLRKQWIVHERLLFPLVQVPIAMIGEKGTKDRHLSSFFKNPIVWLGALVPLMMNSQRALHNYYPAFPVSFPIWKYYYFWHGAFFIRLSVSYAVVGFGYLLDTKMGFSIWFLGLLTMVERAVFQRVGISSAQRVSYDALGSPLLVHQGFGAMMALAGVILWTGRRHLRDVFRKIGHNDPQVEDRDEMLSYRQAAGLLIVSLGVMSVWLGLSGMSWWVIPLMIGITFATMLGVTRIVAQGGLAVTRTPLLPNDAIVTGVGSSLLGAGNLTALGMTYPWAGEMRTTVISALMHALKLAEIHLSSHRRRLVIAIVLAILTAILTATGTILVLGYRHGGVNLSFWFFGVGSAGLSYDFASYHTANMQGTNWGCWGFVGIGALVQLLLTVASQRFLWWPIHPLCFPVGFIWTTHHLMPSIFYAWIVKVMVLRYGGPKWYRKTRPFFLGMILGQYLSGGLWIVIDGFTGMRGNYLFFW